MIAVASSIKFRLDNKQSASWDNTRHNDRADRGLWPHKYFQKFYDDDTVTLQVKVATGQTIKVYYSEECWGVWTLIDTGTLEVDGDDYDFYEQVIDFADYDMETIQFKVEIYTAAPALYSTWISEPCQILTEADDEILQVEFFNQDEDNYFHVDYSTGISHLLNVESVCREWRPGGEVSVFDNQEEITKTLDEVKRILIFKTDPVPGYLAEMLRVAFAHDRVFVNEVEFVAEALPEVEPFGDLYIFSVNLTQKSVIGLNTHDVGFDCDSVSTDDSMIVLQELAASGQKSFAITDDYMILTITGERVAGSPTITAGTTAGGTDILTSMALTESYTVEVALVPVDKASISGGTLYVEVSGAGATANIYVTTIKNRQ